jgi:hypothetical protein
MVKQRLFCIVLTVLLGSIPLAAQDAGTKAAGSVNVLYRLKYDEDFFVVAAEAGAYLWDDYIGPFPDTEFWFYSLEVVLGNAKNIAQTLRCTSGPDPVDQAASRGIPVFVDIDVAGDIDTQRVSVRYSIREIFSALNVVEGLIEEGIPSEDDMLSYFWLPISADLDQFIEAILKAPLEIRGPAGAMVYGFTAEPLRMPSAEVLYLDVPMPGTYRWRMTHPQYTEREGVFLADDGHLLLDLPRQPFYPTTIDLSLHQGRFPELWVSRYLNSYGFFFGLGLRQQFFGIALADTAGPLETSFSTQPLVMPGLFGGYRFSLGEPYLPKPYVLGTLLFRVNTANPSFDDFSPLEFDLTLGYDWEMPFKVRFFAELGMGFYLLNPQSYMNSASKGSGGDAGFVQIFWGGDFMYFELPVIRLGVRAPLPF